MQSFDNLDIPKIGHYAIIDSATQTKCTKLNIFFNQDVPVTSTIERILYSLIAAMKLS